MKCTLLSGVALAALATTAHAAVLDSSQFANQYEANAIPTSASPAWARNGLVPTATGGILTINTNPDDDAVTPSSGTTNAWSFFSIAQGTAWDVQAGKPFAVEMMVKLADAPDNTLSTNTKSRSGLKLAIGDGTRQANITIVNSGVRDTNSLNTLSSLNNQDGNYHKFQIVVSADHLTYDVYRDDAAIATSVATSASANDAIFFGDDNNSGNNGVSPTFIVSRGRDINVGVDYVRWDAAVVPEPASLGMLAISGLVMLRRRR